MTRRKKLGFVGFFGFCLSSHQGGNSDYSIMSRIYRSLGALHYALFDIVKPH